MHHKILVQWLNHSREIVIHEDATAKDLKRRCLFFLPPKVRHLFNVWINRFDGYTELLKEDGKFGNLATCNFIDLKQSSSNWYGLPAKIKIPVHNILMSDSVSKTFEIYMDIENCCTPKGKSCRDILERLKSILGPPFIDITIYVVGSASAISKARQQLGSIQGVNISMVGHTDCQKLNAGDSKPKKKLNTADSKIINLIHKSSAAGCRKEGRVVVLISGDKDYSTTLHILETSGIPTVLVRKAGLDSNLSLWSTVTITYEDLCRNLQNSSDEINVKDLKTQKSLQESIPGNEEVDEFIGSPDMSEMNVNLKTRNSMENGNCSLLHLGAQLKGPLVKKVQVIFCNTSRKLNINPWDTVGAVKGQVAFLLINEEGCDFNNGLISCSVAGTQLCDDENMYDLTEENTEIYFSIPSASVAQVWTFCDYDHPINFSTIPEKNSEAVVLWDLRFFPIPENKNGLHMVKRVIDRFCYGCKIKNFNIFTDKAEVPYSQEMCFFLVNNIICSVKNISSEIKRKLSQDLKTIERIIIMTGDGELLQFIDGLKTTHPNIIVIPNHQFTSDTEGFTYKDLTTDLPDRLQDIVDLNKKIVVEGDLTKRGVRRALGLKIQVHGGIGSYMDNFAYCLLTFQTENVARNFKKLVDGSEIISGCKLTAKFSLEADFFGKAVQEITGHDELRNESLPDGNLVPPVPDSIYQGGLNVKLKQDPSNSAGVSAANENFIQDERAAEFENLMDHDKDSVHYDEWAHFDFWSSSDDPPEEILSEAKKMEYQKVLSMEEKIDNDDVDLDG